MRGRIGVLVLLAGLAMPGLGEACAVCFGAEDAAMTVGMNNGIFTLLGVIGAVQVGFVGLFVGFWRRSRKMRRRDARFGLIQGGGE